MPNARIETRRGWIGTRQADLIEAVHAAMRAALKIPEYDRTLSLIEHEPACFGIPPHCSERYVLVEITLFAGRSRDAKRRLYQEIVERLGAFDVPPGDVKVTLIESPLENWGIRGGQAACDVDLGFEVKV